MVPHSAAAVSASPPQPAKATAQVRASAFPDISAAINDVITQIQLAALNVLEFVTLPVTIPLMLFAIVYLYNTGQLI